MRRLGRARQGHVEAANGLGRLCGQRLQFAIGAADKSLDDLAFIASRSDRNAISADPFLREVALHIFLLLHQQADIARPLGYPVRLAAERLRRTLKVVRPLIERNPFSRPRTQPRRFYRPALISSVRVSDVSTEVFWCVPETETIDAQRRLSGI